MAKSRLSPETEASVDAPALRERIEIALFIGVEVLCLILFVDFLFFGFYVK